MLKSDINHSNTFVRNLAILWLYGGVTKPWYNVLSAELYVSFSKNSYTSLIFRLPLIFLQVIDPAAVHQTHMRLSGVCERVARTRDASQEFKSHICCMWPVAICGMATERRDRACEDEIQTHWAAWECSSIIVSLDLLRVQRLRATGPTEMVQPGESDSHHCLMPLFPTWWCCQAQACQKNYISLLHRGTAPNSLMNICSDSSHVFAESLTQWKTSRKPGWGQEPGISLPCGGWNTRGREDMMKKEEEREGWIAPLCTRVDTQSQSSRHLLSTQTDPFW